MFDAKGKSMKSTILRFVVSGVLSLGLCSSGLAQAQQQKLNGPGKAATVTVTGCLQKGDESGEYSIIGADGKGYGLRSTTVKLADHLNHKITVTGKTVKEQNEKEKNEQHKHLNVTNLKMISNSCK